MSRGHGSFAVPCPLGRLRILHVPKSGSSFASLVWAYGCPRLDPDVFALRVVSNDRDDKRWQILGKNFDETINLRNISRRVRRERCECLHKPSKLNEHYHHDALHPFEESKAAGLFRHPAARVVSAFNHQRHTHWLSQHSQNRLNSALQSRKQRHNRTARLLTFAGWPGNARPVTRLLLGMPPTCRGLLHECRAEPPPTEAEMERALNAVRRMAFVGLTECYNESVALFMRVAAADRPRLEATLRALATRHVRQGTVGAGRGGAALEAERLREWLRDPADDRVYRTAAKLFHARRAAAGVAITTAECAATLAM